jgi:DNA mismatch repair ATPase MutS
MNVPDCKGKESLFEAEMKRSKYNLDKLKEIDGQGFSLMIMDEIFNSTNPVEGISGAYAIMKAISSYKTNLMVFTTHYVYLTNLSKECNFKNMHMSVDIEKDNEDKVNNISFPFILSDGVCRQYIALDLLKINGFDADLIDNAIAIKNKFVS